MQKTIYLAGGCFWGIQYAMRRMPGVLATTCGYANGRSQADATYERVCQGTTGFRECVRVVYDPALTSLDRLLFAFFALIDPTAANRQGNDVGSQYQAGIYWEPQDGETMRRVMHVAGIEAGRVAGFMVELAPCSCFYEAEGYHQDYLEHNPGGYCHIAPSTVEMLARGVTDPGRWPRPQEEVLADALSPLAFEVTQYAATEHPFTGDYWNATAPGLYVDVATGEPLFSSADKYVSSCGWPAFTRALDPAAVVTLLDTSHGMVRDEVRSRAGNSHLGHVFTGDPESPNGVRFCINSAALAFVPLERMEAAGYGEYVPFVTGAAEKSRG